MCEFEVRAYGSTSFGTWLCVRVFHAISRADADMYTAEHRYDCGLTDIHVGDRWRRFHFEDGARDGCDLIE